MGWIITKHTDAGRRDDFWWRFRLWLLHRPGRDGPSALRRQREKHLQAQRAGGGNQVPTLLDTLLINNVDPRVPVFLIVLPPFPDLAA